MFIPADGLPLYICLLVRLNCLGQLLAKQSDRAEFMAMFFYQQCNSTLLQVHLWYSQLKYLRFFPEISLQTFNFHFKFLRLSDVMKNWWICIWIKYNTIAINLFKSGILQESISFLKRWLFSNWELRPLREVKCKYSIMVTWDTEDFYLFSSTRAL